MGQGMSLGHKESFAFHCSAQHCNADANQSDDDFAANYTGQRILSLPAQIAQLIIRVEFQISQWKHQSAETSASYSKS